MESRFLSAPPMPHDYKNYNEFLMDDYTFYDE